MSEPKENKCVIEFACFSSEQGSCVYFKTYHSGVCVYRNAYDCKSKIAQANALTLKLKEITGE